MSLLRDGLLDGVRILAAPRTPLTDHARALGAHVEPLEADLLDEDATRAAATPAHVLVVDAAALFGAGGPERLRIALDSTWSAVRAHFAADRPGLIILVAPRPGQGPHAASLGTGLENLARVLSIEWSRHDVRTTAVRPGPGTTDADLSDLIAFLASPAGEYYSGCAFSLS